MKNPIISKKDSQYPRLFDILPENLSAFSFRYYAFLMSLLTVY